MIDAQIEDRRLKMRSAGIVGAGTMGRGIAQVLAAVGIRTRVYDTAPNAARVAIAFINDVMDRAVGKGRTSRADAAALVERLDAVDALSALADCDIVVESIVEDLDAKRALFRELEEVVSPASVLVTNTSSLSVTAIAAGCRTPQRVAGLHFFNPAPLMKLVEIIPGARTDPAVTEALVDLAARLGHRAVLARDTPGFLVNHAGRGYGTEALRVLAEGVANPADIDRVMRDVAGFRMGPFELLDLTGLDVSHPVMESIYHQFYEEPRFRPSPETARRLAAGLLGRKAGEGFYRYSNGERQEATEPTPPCDRPPAVWMSGANPDARAKVVEFLRALPQPPVIDTGATPDRASLALLTPTGVDATTAAIEQQLDAERVVAVDTILDWHRRPTLMPTPATRPGICGAAHGLFAAGGAPVTMIRDSPGFIAQRILAMVVNVSCEIAQQRIASPSDIDDGAKLGLGYPAGPLELGDQLGPRIVLEILEGVQRLTGDMRYRPSLWLRRRAQLGLSLRTPD
jgi:3-hydroxybutyryl-CoA dehydrogenase